MKHEEIMQAIDRNYYKLKFNEKTAQFVYICDGIFSCRDCVFTGIPGPEGCTTLLKTKLRQYEKQHPELFL